MKLKLPTLTIFATVELTAAAALAQTPPPGNEIVPPVVLEKKEDHPRNRIALSYRMGLNITADFKKLGGLAASSNPNSHTDPAHTNTVIRTYDNGSYVGRDITGNDHGPGFENTTWYWGYGGAGSVQGDTLVFNSSSSPATAVSRNNSDDPQHGLELTYSRELLQKNKWRFGVESGLGYTHLSISDGRTLTATVNRITDTYSIPSGVVLPPAGYQGTYEGPGAVIGADPSGHTATIVSAVGTNTIVGGRSLDANVFSLRLGPYAEYALNRKFSLLVGGGLYLVVGETRFRFHETVTVVDPLSGVSSTETHRGSNSQTDFLVGGYVGGNLEYALTDRVDLFVGAQFQSAGREVTRSRGKAAILDMGKSVVVSIGASYSF